MTKGANTSLDLTSGPAVDVSSSVTAGDILYLKTSSLNLGDGLKVSSVNSTAIVVQTAPTQDQLNTTSNATLAQSASVSRRWEYYNFFDAAPGTSTYATRAGGSSDELHIAVVDEDGEWTGVKGQVIERFPAISRASDAKAFDGSNIYYKEVINQRSRYVWWASHVDTMTSAGSTATTAFSVTSDQPQTV